MEFTLTESHIKLLKSMYVGWSPCEYGAPEIDPKRPYGNSSVEHDIHEILTGEEPDGELDDDLSYEYYKLHKETQTALEIVLRTGQFEPGVYSTSTPYKRDWKLVTESDPLF
jgi:hypothetical protein